MLYLLDANVLIDANRDYYPIERVPEFWDWMKHQGTTGRIKVPLEIYEEIRDGDDQLADWIKEGTVKAALVLQEEAQATLVAQVVNEAYAPDLADDEVQRLGRDPFLVAYALVAADARCIVTTEVSKPRRQRANRHLPDVCRTLGIDSCNTFELTRRLNFRTGWAS